MKKTRQEALKLMQQVLRELDARTEIPVTVMHQQGAHSYGTTVMIPVHPRPRHADRNKKSS